jgi:hypothetical protein
MFSWAKQHLSTAPKEVVSGTDNAYIKSLIHSYSSYMGTKKAQAPKKNVASSGLEAEAQLAKGP